MYAPEGGTTLTRVAPQALGVSGQVALVWGPSGSETEIALGDHALRSYTTRPVLEPTRTSVTWTEEPEGEVGDLVLLEASAKTDRVRLQLVLDDVSCADCILAPDELFETVQQSLQRRIPGEFELLLDDPRRG